MVRIACLGIGGHDGFVFEPVVQEFRDRGYEITLYSADSTTLDENLEELQSFLKHVGVCDIAFVHVHGDVTFFRHWGSLRTVLESAGVSTFVSGCEADLLAQYRHLFRQSDADFGVLRELQAIGGDDNQRATLIWCLKIFDGAGLEVPASVRPLAQGVYVPGKGATALDEGLRDVGKTGKPVILINFADSFWINHNTGAMDILYREVEKIGGEPVAVFLRSYADELTGSIGMAAVIDRHLLRGGKPIVDAVINTMGFSMTLLSQPGCGEQVPGDSFFERLGVPIIQAINLYGPAKEWADSPFGLAPADIAMSVVNPEYDGQIDSVPYCGTEKTEGGDYKQVAIEGRCNAIAEMAYNWARLRRIAEKDKKVAIIIYMYPPRRDLAGGGYGLDTLQSVSDMLHWLGDAGYSLDWMPKDGKDLATRLLDGVTNDNDWKSEQQIRDAAVDTVPADLYKKWFSQIPESARKAFEEGWGEPPGDHLVLGDEQLLPGIMDGNVFIGFQPDRGKCTTEAYHDPWAAPPHQYLGFYRWLKYVWKADAVVHVGTHGTLEWLPGKSVGLSGECDPDIILGRMPDINPYIIDNPGEGMQSKRRQYAVTTTYLHPAMARSGGYDEINELESAVQAYLKAKDYNQRDKLPIIMERVIELSAKLNMTSEIGLSADCSAEEMDAGADRLYDYILEVKDALIKDGLHILGQVPGGRRMAETIYMLVRYPNGDVPSLRESVAHSYGHDMEDLLQHPSGVLPDGRLKGEVTDEIDGVTFDLILKSQEIGYDFGKTMGIAKEMFPDMKGDMPKAIGFMCGFLIDAVRRMGDELGNVLKALDGRYVPPGPSGCPARGRAQILPAGRNFYSIDPDGIPWHSSWEIGSKMAEQMVRRYTEDNGVYPKSVGIVLWATDTMKTGGDDVSYILKLMGLRPAWAEYGGRVKGLEVIPL